MQTSFDFIFRLGERLFHIVLQRPVCLEPQLWAAQLTLTHRDDVRSSQVKGISPLQTMSVAIRVMALKLTEVAQTEAERQSISKQFPPQIPTGYGDAMFEYFEQLFLKLNPRESARIRFRSLKTLPDNLERSHIAFPLSLWGLDRPVLWNGFVQNAKEGWLVSHIIERPDGTLLEIMVCDETAISTFIEGYNALSLSLVDVLKDAKHVDFIFKDVNKVSFIKQAFPLFLSPHVSAETAASVTQQVRFASETRVF